MSESTQSEGEIGQEDISFDLEDKAGISNQTRSLAAIAIEGENDTIETVSAHNEEEPSQSSTNQSPSSTSIATEIKRDTTVCTFSTSSTDTIAMKNHEKVTKGSKLTRKKENKCELCWKTFTRS